jgi:hypothetical protein
MNTGEEVLSNVQEVFFRCSQCEESKGSENQVI